MKTLMAKKSDIQKKWYLIDARGKILGRLAVKIAGILMGKGKTNFTSHAETGDYVIAVNARDLRVTGKKMTDKEYDHYTGYPGGRKTYTLEVLMAKKPEEVLMHAVKGMLPKNRMGDKLLKHLQVFAGSEHDLKAQKPILLS